MPGVIGERARKALALCRQLSRPGASRHEVIHGLAELYPNACFALNLEGRLSVLYVGWTQLGAVQRPQIPKVVQFHAHWIARLMTGGQEVFWEKALEWHVDDEQANIRRLQEVLQVTVDGTMGPETARAMQRVYDVLSKGLESVEREVVISSPAPRTRYQRMLENDEP